MQSRSQACLPLLNGSADDEERRREREHRHHQAMMNGNPLDCCHFDGSREKLYGLKSLSKSQGMLDIYRSLESLQRHKREQLRHERERSRTEDALPFFRQLGYGSSSGSLGSASSSRSTAVARDFEESESGAQRVVKVVYIILFPFEFVYRANRQFYAEICWISLCILKS